MLCYVVLLCTMLYYVVVCCGMLWYVVLWCTMLYYGMLCCTMLYYVMLCCTMLCYVELCCTMLCYGVLCCAMLNYVVLCCAMVYYVVLCCTMLCYGVLCCAMLCYVVLCFAMLYYVMLCCAILCYVLLCCAMLYYVVLCCAMVYYVALCCAMLNYVVLCRTMLCYGVLCCAMLNYVVLCCAMLNYVVLCCTMFCYVVLCCTMLCYVVLCFAMRLAWIPRLLTPEIRNWKTIPDYYVRKLGGLNFLLRCNYDVKYIDGLPLFYQNILTFFNELKNLYSCEGIQDMVLFNNKEILVGGKPVFIKEWFDCNILFIQDLLNSKGQLLSFREFINKYDCSTNFLQFYQVTSAIPKYLVTKARNTEPPQNGLYTRNNFLFQLDASTQIQLEKAKTRDFYCLLNRKTHTVSQTGPMKWNSIIGLDENAWKIIFTSPKNVCKEPKLKEFQFKLIHRIVVTKKELHRYGIKADDECLYCGEKDSIDHTFLNCQFVKIFVNNVIDWFNAANNSKFAPTIGEKLFGIISGPYEKEIVKKFNYTLLFMKYYIYTSKMHNQAIHLSVFVNKVLFKYRIENFDD